MALRNAVEQGEAALGTLLPFREGCDSLSKIDGFHTRIDGFHTKNDDFIEIFMMDIVPKTAGYYCVCTHYYNR